jgi:hypothetical protein
VYLVLLLPGEARVELVGHGVEAEIEAARKDLVELRAGATKQRRRTRTRTRTTTRTRTRYTRRAVSREPPSERGGIEVEVE